MKKLNFREYVLGAMPGTKTHIVTRSGVSQAAVLRWVRKLHEAGEIYISGWRPHPRAGAHMAIYSIGNQPDVKCKIKALTKRQIRLRFEAKAKEDGRYDGIKARWRSRYWTRKAAAVGDPMVSALFGAAPAREVRNA
ncbi:MAG: hypothetical protein V4724_26735 [Pseudomonadota bacterium]